VTGSRTVLTHSRAEQTGPFHAVALLAEVWSAGAGTRTVVRHPRPVLGGTRTTSRAARAGPLLTRAVLTWGLLTWAVLTGSALAGPVMFAVLLARGAWPVSGSGPPRPASSRPLTLAAIAGVGRRTIELVKLRTRSRAARWSGPGARWEWLIADGAGIGHARAGMAGARLTRPAARARPRAARAGWRVLGPQPWTGVAAALVPRACAGRPRRGCRTRRHTAFRVSAR
jgi:hypothetical protein